MPDDSVSIEHMACQNVFDQVAHRINLRLRKCAVAAIVSGVGDFDANRKTVEIAPSLPVRNARMPCAAVFWHKVEDLALVIDEIVRTNLRSWVRQSGEGLLGCCHAGVMQNDKTHSRGSVHGLARTMIGRGAVNNFKARESGRGHGRPSVSL